MSSTTPLGDADADGDVWCAVVKRRRGAVCYCGPAAPAREAAEGAPSPASRKEGARSGIGSDSGDSGHRGEPSGGGGAAVVASTRRRDRSLRQPFVSGSWWCDSAPCRSAEVTRRKTASKMPPRAHCTRDNLSVGAIAAAGAIPPPGRGADLTVSWDLGARHRRSYEPVGNC